MTEPPNQPSHPTDTNQLQNTYFDISNLAIVKSIINLIRWPTTTEEPAAKPNNSSSGSNSNSFMKTLQNNMKDPLSIFLAGLFGLFIYLYFATDILCCIIGLLYPAYRFYLLLHFRTRNKIVYMKSMMRYFIVYSHIEFISYIVKIIFQSTFNHLKILLFVMLVYMSLYRIELLENLYNKILLYDEISLNIMYVCLDRFKQEYRIFREKLNEKK